MELMIVLGLLAGIPFALVIGGDLAGGHVLADHQRLFVVAILVANAPRLQLHQVALHDPFEAHVKNIQSAISVYKLK